jgi:hypothetical protein
VPAARQPKAKPAAAGITMIDVDYA